MPIRFSDYDIVFCSVSSGKDSQVTMGKAYTQAVKEGVHHRLFAIMADTRAEWPSSVSHADYLAKCYRVPFQVVYPLRPLAEVIDRRKRWPSMSCRYCTSACKREPIAKFIRQRFPFKENVKILMLSGERAEESPHRAKLDEFEPDKELSKGNRQVFKYRPVLGWTKNQIWDAIFASKLDYHIAYKLGNDRVSCALCIFANNTDLRNGARARPDLAEEYLRIEREHNHTFKYKQSLASILNS
jgi:3'-phosphoadenosine 5'-phosphosulfate sulfotransferase (PAPS reductase)/FAD synthetase